MTSQKSLDVARRAEELYAKTLRRELENSHGNEYVAIEPDSAEYFLGATLSEAMQAARRAHPDRLAFGMRVGHSTAVHLGVLTA
jgi:hypothetical protein